jgi:hypothetical protein
MAGAPRFDRIRRHVASSIAAAWLAMVVACSGSPDSPAVAPGPCAARVYIDPHCQKLVSHVCCPEMSACAADASCGRLSVCMLDCKHDVSETCAVSCVHGEPPSPEAQRGLGLYHDMLRCAGNANLAECGPDS